MIEYECTTLHVRIAQHGCHANHAFSHSPNEFMFRNIFIIQGGGGGAGFFLHQYKIAMGCKVGQIRLFGIGYQIFSANLRNCCPRGYSAAHSIFVYQPSFLRVCFLNLTYFST